MVLVDDGELTAGSDSSSMVFFAGFWTELGPQLPLIHVETPNRGRIQACSANQMRRNAKMPRTSILDAPELELICHLSSYTAMLCGPFRDVGRGFRATQACTIIAAAWRKETARLPIDPRSRVKTGSRGWGEGERL